MNFYVPTIGDKIYLEENWHFTLYKEDRNKSLAQAIGVMEKHEETLYLYNIYVEETRASQKPALLVTPREWRNYYSEESAENLRQGYTSRSYVKSFSITKVEGKTKTKKWYTWVNDTHAVFLPPKTCLVVDRIYIRRGLPTFDSITFKVESSPDKRFNKCRFWVKLADANKIVCSLYPVFDTDSRNKLDPNKRFSSLELE